MRWFNAASNSSAEKGLLNARWAPRRWATVRNGSFGDLSG